MIEDSKIRVALVKAMKALDKQAAKKPILKPFNELMRMQICYEILCPTCNYKLNFLEFKGEKEDKFKEMEEWQDYCYKCGQKPDWN